MGCYIWYSEPRSSTVMICIDFHSADINRYLGVFIVRSRSFKCSLDHAKKSFYRSANAIFGKVGRFASEEVTLQLIKSKCIPVLLYGLEVCHLNKSDLRSLDFIINRFFMKLFRIVILKLSVVVRNTSVLLYPAHYGPSVSRNLSFSSVILCILRPVRSVSVRFVILYTSLFHQRNGSSKNTYNIINKQKKHKVNMTVISLVKNITIKL